MTQVDIFSGLLVCPHCGHSMSACTSGGWKYYRCPKHVEHKCVGFSISERKLEDQLLRRIAPAMKQYNVKIERARKKRPDPAAIKAKMDKLTDLYMADLITREKYETDYRAAQKALSDAEQDAAPIDTAAVKTVLDAYTMLSDAGKKVFWSRLVSRIRPTENSFEITLNYTFGNKTEDILSFVQSGINEDADVSKH